MRSGCWWASTSSPWAEPVRTPRKRAVPPPVPPEPEPAVHFDLALYVVGTAPASARAIANARRLCEEHLPGCYDLRIVDLRDEPDRAGEAQVVAAPTLVKTQPPPVRRFIGDLSRAERIVRVLADDRPLPRHKDPA